MLNKAFGVYLVANDISSTGTGACFSISATSITLNFQGHTLTGSGKGVGVRMAGVTGALIENGSITGFATGISTDQGANKLVIQSMMASGNTDGLVASNSSNITAGDSNFDSNLNTGISLLNCRGGNVADTSISGSSTGLFLSGSSGFNVHISAISTSGSGPNSKAGVYLNASNDNTFMNCVMSGNQGYGIWLVKSNNNRFELIGAEGYFAGVFVGCSSIGPGGGSCPGAGGTNNTFVHVVGAHATNGPGIAIDTGNTSNRVVSSGDGTTTLFDGNPNCDSNIWSLNTFSSANQPCIN